MTNKIYTKFRKGFILALSSAILLSCNNDDFFILPDRGGLDAEGLWNTEGAVNMHLNKAYELIIPRFPYQTIPSRFDIHLVSDEHFLASNGSYGAQALGITGAPLNNHDVRYTGNSYNQNYLDNRYMDIARCNNAIKYLPESTIADAVKYPMLGQYYALRAMVYLELVKVYGGVPLVLEPQDPDAVMTDGRASARACFEQIVSDLDHAMEYLKDVKWGGSDWGRLTYEAVAALKGKALLYWASPQFNPLDDPKHPHDASRWQEALIANKEAYDIGLAAGRRLVEEYGMIFLTDGASNPETLISRPYSSTEARRGHDEERKSRPRSESQNGSPFLGYQPTVKLLRAYPMKDGNRIDEPGNYTFNNILFWKDRDPRFEATMAYNGSVWELSGKEGRRQWNYEGATNGGDLESANWAVYCKKFATPSLAEASVPYNDGRGGSGMDWIEMRFAEVILNLADCANETGDMATAKDMVRQIRDRAGIEQGSNDYGLGRIASKEQMRELLLNERMIEFAFENKRNADLRRTRNWSKLSGEFLEVYQLQVFGVDNDARRDTIAKLQTVVNEITGEQFRDRLNLNDEETYLKYFQPHVARPQATNFRAIFIPEYHNFYTFHNDFVRRGVNIETTIGWEGGTFDPLDD